MTVRLVHRPSRSFPLKPTVEQFTLPAAPLKTSSLTVQFTQALLPALTSLAMLSLGVLSSNKSLIITGLIVAGISLASPWVSAYATRKSNAFKYELRRSRYLDIVSEVERSAFDEVETVKTARRWAHPSPRDLLAWIRSERLWERRLDDQDLLEVSVGSGTCLSGLSLSCATQISLDGEIESDIRSAVDDLRMRIEIIDGAPITIDLSTDPILAVTGARGRCVNMAYAIALEFAVTCSPDDLQIVVYSPDLLTEWDWMRWLPHCRRSRAGDNPARLMAVDGAGLESLITEVINPRLALRERSDIDKQTYADLPRVLIVLDQFDPVLNLAEVPSLSAALRHGPEVGVAIVALVAAPLARPEETAALLSIGDDGQATLERFGGSTQRSKLVVAGADIALADQTARALFSCRPANGALEVDRVDSDRLLDILATKLSPEIAPEPGWQPTSSLMRVPFGSTDKGDVLELDLKESASGGYGPHGLVVGATGSGKSELLRSVVSALALRHVPEQVSMLFADFKGGATFNLLSDLPHCTGLITNLQADLSLVDRMKAAILGEQARRQRDFFLAGRNVQKLADYHELCRSRPELPSHPYLVIVIDEFGELLEARPDFLEVFLALGRTGRSTGMHLMLATQRLDPARLRGLETYLSYRICLKTFTADESVAAIGSRLASELPGFPGQGYLRTSESLTRFKSARVAMQFVEAEVSAQDVATVGLEEMIAQGSSHAVRVGEPALHDSDLAAIVDALRNRPRSAPLWLDPLEDPNGPSPLRLEQLPAVSDAPNGLPVPIGRLDLPAEREQPILTYDPCRLDGNLLVLGAARTGKSNLLKTLVLSASSSYGAERIQFHAIDLGAAALASLSSLANVGSVAGAGDAELVRRILVEFDTAITDRERSFRTTGVDRVEQLRARRDGDDLQSARLVLILDNYPAFRQRFPIYEDLLNRVIADGPAVGVHAVLTAARVAEVRPTVLDRVATRIEMRINEPRESVYSTRLAASVPVDTPGRGIGPGGHAVQIARSPDATVLRSVLERIFKQARARGQATGVEPLLMLSDLRRDRWDIIEKASFKRGEALLGVSETGFQAVSFGSKGHNVVCFGDRSTRRTSFLERLVAARCAIGSAKVEVFLIDFSGELFSRLAARGIPVTCAFSSSEAIEMVAQLSGQLDDRRRIAAEQLRKRGDRSQAAEMRPLMLVIDDYELLHAGKSAQQLQSLNEYLMFAERLNLSIVVNQTARGIGSRSSDLFMKRLIDSGCDQMYFGIDSKLEVLPGGRKGQQLPPGRAILVRQGEPDCQIQAVLAKTD